jgi:hypothetical protein
MSALIIKKHGLLKPPAKSIRISSGVLSAEVIHYTDAEVGGLVSQKAWPCVWKARTISFRWDVINYLFNV